MGKKKGYYSEDDWKLVIRYRTAGGWVLKEIMHSELYDFQEQKGIKENDLEVVEIHKPCGEVIR